jgi:hypothetical protein
MDFKGVHKVFSSTNISNFIIKGSGVFKKTTSRSMLHSIYLIYAIVD